MQVLGGTLARYFGLRFFTSVVAVFAGLFVLVVMLDFIELTRRAADIPNFSTVLVLKTSLFRVPQLTERILPFCILIAGMSCYLNLSRRLELVVARASGMSAWQFITPALVVAFVIGVVATAIYNPISAVLQERAKQLEAQLFGENQVGTASGGSTFWARQRSSDGQAIINARSSRQQGVELAGVTVFAFDADGKFKERIEARDAVLEPGFWRLSDVRIYAITAPPHDLNAYQIKTSLTPEQVRESFATPETVPFWQLPLYINIAEQAGLNASGYRLQYQKLLARPFLLSAMVFLAASVSLRFFRFGGVQKMVLGGVTSGFLLYVLSKVTEDLSKAELMHPAAAAWLPVLAGGMTGFFVLLFQEDG